MPGPRSFAFVNHRMSVAVPGIFHVVFTCISWRIAVFIQPVNSTFQQLDRFEASVSI